MASGQLTDLVRGTGFFSHPDWNPDGKVITVEFESPVQTADIYRVAVPDGGMQQLTFSMPPALAGRQLAKPELVTYPSFDGKPISALLYKPAIPNGAGIVHPHGGPSAQYIYDFDVLAQYLVAKGYTFIAPNYRGSTGYGVAFEHSNYNDWGARRYAGRTARGAVSAYAQVDRPETPGHLRREPGRLSHQPVPGARSVRFGASIESVTA